MSTLHGGLEIDKVLVGDCKAQNVPKVEQGGTIDWDIRIRNSGQTCTVSIADLQPLLLEDMAWEALAENAAGDDITATVFPTASGSGSILLTELEIPTGTYAAIAVTGTVRAAEEGEPPLCGTVTNTVLWCKPGDKTPSVVSAPPVRVGDPENLVIGGRSFDQSLFVYGMFPSSKNQEWAGFLADFVNNGGSIGLLTYLTLTLAEQAGLAFPKPLGPNLGNPTSSGLIETNPQGQRQGNPDSENPDSENPDEA